eukprot:Opistho-2@27062
MGIGERVKYGLPRENGSQDMFKPSVVAPRPVKPITHPIPVAREPQHAARNEILEILQSCESKHAMLLGSSPPARAANPVAQNSPFCGDSSSFIGVELGLLTPSPPPPLHKRGVAT